ncbi:MAG: GAF domain-containing protein [Nannocystis sp.]|nr:GAF domain-containing protein [Nannocystis sp.]
MDTSSLHRQLAALGISAERPPDASAWRALLARLQDDTAGDELRRRERYLEAVVEMQARLLTSSEDHLGAFNHALAPLGEAAGASRVYLFENHRRPSDGALVTSQRAEWCAAGVCAEIDNPALQGLAYDDFLPRWADVMARGERIEMLAREYDELERMILAPQGILSILVIPLMVDGEFTGFIGFDNCAVERRWGAIEVNLLSAAATQIGLILAQRRAQRQLARANAEVATARDRAVEASRAKSVFLAKISHELRTPLNAILGYTELLLEQPGERDEAELSGDLRRIESAGRHLLTVINDLLDLSRAEADKISLRIEPVELTSLLADVIGAARHLARRHGNRLVTELPAQLGELLSDRTRVHQILLNLLSNACKYTHDGEVRLTVLAHADALEFQIHDTGIGIAPAQIERIFDAFTQADDAPTRAYEGTGLGLTISRHLSRILGGAIDVTSALGRGSTFTFTLPRHVRPALSLIAG